MGCGSSHPIFAAPGMASMMQGAMRKDMNKLMKVTEHNNDPTYKEVQDFMVPSSVGKPFVDAPGTFDPNMEGRIKDKKFPMVMHRFMMVQEGGINAKGITWEKFCEHRGYACPGYIPKCPQPGDIVPDGKILSLDENQPASTLLTEARKLAAAKNHKKVIIAFCAVTCPFYRAYAAEDLYKVSNRVPTLSVYLREAEPCDVFDAGGMHCTTPLRMKRFVKWHKTEADRRLVAKETQAFLETFMGKGNAPMWIDVMEDTLEALYEARPWRQYIIEAESAKLIASTGLAPFNMDGKIKVVENACK